MPKLWTEELFWNNVRRTPDGCWEWQAARHNQGYGITSQYGKMWRAHRLASTLADGPIPEGLHLLHTCDNPPCCRPSHLVRGTAHENILDSVAKGRYVRGQRQHSCKLANEQVREIAALHASGVSERELARRYPVSRTAIRSLLAGRTWAWLLKEEA